VYDKESLLVETTLARLSGKWRMSILCNLTENGTTRFNDLKKRLPGISQRMLTAQLKKLESEGLVSRQVFGEVPPRVEYAVTDAGRDLEAVIVAIYDWGAKYLG
jgi:DNA-binding HxlR family transcriptional regulator